MNPVARLAVMAAIWIAWLIPFIVNRTKGQGTAVKVDPRARVGIVLVALGYMFANTHSPRVWSEPVDPLRAAAGIVFGALAVVIAWMAVGNLGRQWRVDAGLNDDHALVKTGAYRVVRHPIYLSMLLILSMNIAMIGTLPGWPIAIVLALTGTEIRVRIEDSLLAERFGTEFREWQSRVPAYLPFIR
jgi:protein-S-isoprenylcysteine O-methyltransferase Ste14